MMLYSEAIIICYESDFPDRLAVANDRTKGGHAGMIEWIEWINPGK